MEVPKLLNRLTLFVEVQGMLPWGKLFFLIKTSIAHLFIYPPNSLVCLVRSDSLSASEVFFKFLLDPMKTHHLEFSIKTICSFRFIPYNAFLVFMRDIIMSLGCESRLYTTPLIWYTEKFCLFILLFIFGNSGSIFENR